jgi:hypothetical protein
MITVVEEGSLDNLQGAVLGAGSEMSGHHYPAW